MADPISAAIAAFAFSAGASIATATVVGAVAANVIIAAGTQLAINALTPKAKVTATASQLQTKIGAVTPRAIIMGRTAVAGTLLTPTPLKSGKDDRFASNFYALSHAGPSGVVESIQWGDDVVTFDGNGNAIGKYNDNMWLFQKNGDWSQTAISYVGHAVLGSSTPSAWDSTKTGKGCLMVALVVRYAAKVLGGNMQTPLFVVDANAAVLIDPRTGLAATTQAQRRNPAVWAYSWRLGWFQNSKRVIGMGQASSEIHTAAYAYAANVADANSWTIGGEATTADDRYAVETIILQTCASVPVERNGLQSVVTSAVRSSVGTISSDDLRADPKWRYNTQQSSRPTAIQTRYRSETNRWQMIEGAEVTDAGWLTADAGREKRVTVEYPYAAGGSAHVGHLAALEASNAREPLIFTLQCKQQARYDGFVGDAVTVSLPEIGLSSTKMIITSRVVNPDGTVDFDLLVETDAKYSFAAGKTSAAPSFTLQPGFDINSVPQPGASEWAAVAAQITSGTTSLPIVRVTGSAADYSFASGVVFKLRLNSGGSPWLVAEDAPPASTQHEFRGLTNATGYIVGVAYRGVTGVEGPIRELAAVTTGALVAGEAGTATTVPWTGVTGSGRPEDNATIGARVGTNLFPNVGSTPLPGTQVLNSEIGIDANGRLTNTGTGSAVVGNAQITIDANGRLTTTGTGSAIVDNGKITIDANGRLTTTGTGSVVVDNSKITLGTLGFTGATDATRNVVSTGLLSARPTGVDGDLFFATDDNNGAGLLYTKIAGAWVADPKAKVLFDSLTTTVNANEATNSSFRSSQTTNNSAQAASLTTLEAQVANTAGSGLQSRISTEESARASADTALASRATTLEAQVANTAGSGLQSRISTEESARASADSALATRATNLEATVNDGTTGVTATAARLTTEESTRASADSALATRATNLESTVNNGTTGVAATAARLTTEEGTRATADTALAGRATTLEATVNNATTGVAATAARLTTEEGARATADTALAARATTLEATVNDGTTGLVATRARLVTEEGTRATADTALATRSTTLEAQMANTSASGLQSRISTEESARASADSTLASRSTTLESQMANTSASGLQSRIATEESTRASADSTQASQITTLTAQTNGNPNLFPYPTPIANRTPSQLGWTGTAITSTFSSGVGGLIYYRARGSGGSAVNEAYQFDLPESMTFSTGQQFTFSCYGYGGASVIGDRLYAYLDFRSADNSTSLYTSPTMTLNSGGTRQSVTGTFPGSFTTGRLRVIFLREWPSSGAYQDVVFNMIKVECGPTATAFTNSAQVIVQSNAIATINDSAAFYQILVAATGGDPALIRLFSGLGGSEVAIAAKIISLVNTTDGSALEVMRAIGGLAFFRRPISADSSGRRVTIGPGFGVGGSQVVLWFGPDTIAPDAQSRTNGYFALGTDGIIYYGAAVLGSPVSATRKVDSNMNGTAANGSWQTVASVVLSNCPGGNLYFDGSFFSVATGTGTCDHKARITIDGTLAGSELATQNTVTGGTPSAVIMDDLFAQILTVTAGSRTIAFQLQRTTGSGNIDTSSTRFDVSAFPV